MRILPLHLYVLGAKAALCQAPWQALGIQAYGKL